MYRVKYRRADIALQSFPFQKVLCENDINTGKIARRWIEYNFPYLAPK